MRLDALLATRELYASRSVAARMIEGGCVFVGGVLPQKKYVVSAGETIVYKEAQNKEGFRLIPQNIALDIRYEDDDLIVLSKQAGLVCHPSPDHMSNTLVNALLYHCGADNLCNVQGQDDRPGIVHRLDGDTSGLMLAAKTNEAGYALMHAIAMRTVSRHYLALVHGIINPDTGMIDAPLARSLNERTRMSVRECSSARDAITTFRVLERFSRGAHDNGYTLIECKLFTGRTHQIRVHMQYTHHPVVGDYMYNSHAPSAESAQLGLERQFLHSWHVVFEHPQASSELEFYDWLPRDLYEVLDHLAPRSLGKTKAGEELFAAHNNLKPPHEVNTTAKEFEPLEPPESLKKDCMQLKKA